MKPERHKWAVLFIAGKLHTAPALIEHTTERGVKLRLDSGYRGWYRRADIFDMAQPTREDAEKIIRNLLTTG